jgi:hypothetical protein
MLGTTDRIFATTALLLGATLLAGCLTDDDLDISETAEALTAPDVITDGTWEAYPAYLLSGPWTMGAPQYAFAPANVSDASPFDSAKRIFAPGNNNESFRKSFTATRSTYTVTAQTYGLAYVFLDGQVICTAYFTPCTVEITVTPGTTHWLSASTQNSNGPGFALVARAHDVALSPSPALTGAKLLSFSSGGDPYLMAYRTNAPTTVAALSGSGAQTAIGTFDSDWKHIVPFTYQGNPYLLFVRNNGEAATYGVSPSGISNGTNVGTFDSDWKHIVSFTYDGAPYLLFTKEGSGWSLIYQVSPSGLSGGVAVGNFDTSWKQIVSFTDGGVPYLLFYREGGQLVSWQVSPTGISSQRVLGNLDADWKLTTFTTNDNARLLLTRENSSETWAYDLSPTALSHGQQVIAP